MSRRSSHILGDRSSVSLNWEGPFAAKGPKISEALDPEPARRAGGVVFARRTGERDDGEDSDYRSGLRPDAGRTQGAEVGRTTGRDQGDRGGARPWGPVGKRRIRSEEHTSELQSLMRSTYAVS